MLPKDKNLDDDLYFNLVNNNDFKIDILNKFENGKIDSNNFGFILYNQIIYTINCDIGKNCYIYKKRNKNEHDITQTKYCDIYTKKFDVNLPNPNYTKYNYIEFKKPTKKISKKKY